jgi:hypothetical protein
MMQLPPGFRKKTSAALPPKDSDVESYITEAATKRGIPVEDALSVWSGEGKGAWQSNYHKRGVREPSYGPYQLYKGGGLGNAFQRDTGLDPADPSTWKQGVDYALDTAKKEGWKQWYGAPPELRARGGYDDQAMMLGPAGDTGGRLQLPPGFKKKGAAPARAYPNPSHGGDLTTDVEAPKTPPPELSWEETGRDVANNVTSKTIDAVTFLAGLPGDAIEGAQWLDRKLGINSKGSDTPVDFASDDIRSGLKDKIGDWKYEPKTNAAKLAGYVPYVASGGVARGARGVAQIAGGAMGAQAGEEIGGPVGEVVGLVAGSRLGAKPVPRGKAPKITDADRALSEADQVMGPGTAAVKRTSQEAYREADAMGVQIGGQSFHNFQRALDADPVLHKLKLDPQKHQKLSATFDRIRGGAMGNITARPGSTTMNLEEFGNLRDSITRHLGSKDADERRLAGHMLNRLEDFFDKSVTPQFPQAKAVLTKARHNWKQFEKSKEIDTIMEVAKDRAGQYSVSGNENAIRTGFRQLSVAISRDKTGRLRRLWTPDEIRMIRQLSRGRWSPRNALRIIGKLSPNVFSGTATVGGAGASYATGDPTYALLGAGAMGAGALARGASGALAKGKVNQLSNLIRSGGQMNRPNRAQPLISGYLTARDEE